MLHQSDVIVDPMDAAAQDAADLMKALAVQNAEENTVKKT